MTMRSSTVTKNNKKSLIAFRFAIGLFVLGFGLSNQAAAAIECNRTLTADIVAFDMPLMWNRLGAHNINGQMFALKRDVVNLDTDLPLTHGGAAVPGRVALRPDKRPRPLVLRLGAGDCLTYTVTNLLTPQDNPFNEPEERSLIPFNLHINNQVKDRRVSLRFQGMELVNDISDDGSFVGANDSSLVAQGATSEPFTIHGREDGSFVGNSYGATTGGEGLGGNTASGLWAVINVNSSDSAFYRSQLTREEMDLATDGTSATGHPIINYEATYPDAEPWISEGKAGLPILNMVHTYSFCEHDESGEQTEVPADGCDAGSTEKTVNEMVHSDINAIVGYGPDLVLDAPDSGPYVNKIGHFPPETYPLENAGFRNPTVPNRLEPFREFTVAFHDETATMQAFPGFFDDAVLSHTLHGVRDAFMINYSSGGIGSEIIASRLRVGPSHDCLNCAYEEFFLTAFTVGDVGMLVDVPANLGLEECNINLENCTDTGPKANYALYPDDPSGVHHGYTGDATAFRNVHAGPAEAHVFHLHNHQWLFNADDDNSSYLDAQGLGPGAGYAYWVNLGGGGNRNKTAGDAIFHCHFYPHFAQGMWEMWRVHDVFEQGTTLSAQSPTVDGDMDGKPDRRASFVEDGLGIGDGTPAENARALPDGEIIAGTPIPAVVPLPGKAMAPMPVAGVTVKENANTVCIDDTSGGLVAKNGGACPASTTERSTGSLAEVPRIAYPNDHQLAGTLQNPGYPFWIAGIEHSVGQRPPTPPLDMLTASRGAELQATGNPLWQHPGIADADAIDGWDGGLPRFTVDGFSAGGEAVVALTRLDFSREMLKARPFFFPEEGTDIEQAAMAFHALRCHDTSRPNGDPANCPAPYSSGPTDGFGPGFVLNGAPPVPGAPFNEPCIDDKGTLLAEGVTGNFFDGNLNAWWDDVGMTTEGRSPHNATDPRVYKAANVQFDAVFNKRGYHFSQERIITLWQDVVPTIEQRRAPEPFVLRLNTFDCTQYVQTNLIPKVYELDDYQVRTPTDVIGQHIHLPKWDLVSADGAANGWNYEDGILSPQMVVEVIEAINHYQDDTTLPDITTDVMGNSITHSAGPALDGNNHLHPLDHPFFKNTPFAARWIGARNGMQRWFADPVVNVHGVDRGLGVIFTHDHFGPSTHQQTGLYATVLTEPAGSKWVHNETGTELGQMPDGSNQPDRIDGGPTSWQAAILTGDNGYKGQEGEFNNVGAELVDNHREFFLEYADFQHAYQPEVYVGADAQGFALEEYHFVEGPEISPGLFLNLNQITGPGFGGVTADTFRDAIQPSFRLEAPHNDSTSNFPLDIWVFPPYCPGDVTRPCSEAITADDPGMYTVNYRNESLAARIYDPNKPGPDAAEDQNCSNSANRSGCGTQADGKAGDLAFAMQSNVQRVLPELNDKLGLAPATYAGDPGGCSDGTGTNVFCPPINDLGALSGGDPFTPMLRVFDGDRVHIKAQAGAHEEEHHIMVHGLKWLLGGSSYGEAKNSGWRNAIAGGISEKFAFKMPVIADSSQRGGMADYAYTANASFDGWNNGVWGIMRSYSGSQNDLFVLPGNDATKDTRIANAKDFVGVCPKTAPNRDYDLTAVLAEDVLPVPAGVTVKDWFPRAHEGRAPNGGTLVYNSRSTEVPGIQGCAIEPAGEEECPPEHIIEGPSHYGPLHDPTAILYVNTMDLVADDAYLDSYKKKGKDVYYWNSADSRCINGGSGVQHLLRTCPVRLRPAEPEYCPDGGQTGVGGPYTSGGFCDVAWSKQATQPPNGVYDAAVAVEPIVIRANAGDCINVTLRNKLLEHAKTKVGDYLVYDDGGNPVFEDPFNKPKGLNADTDGDGLGDTPYAREDIDFDGMPDLATGNAITGIVRRDRDNLQGMTTFQSNLMVPSATVGLHPTLVDYDVTRADGTNVGQNPAQQTAGPGEQRTYQWYAGLIEARETGGPSNKRNFELVATPIELGGFNIMPTDKLEQPQKGLIAAGVIYPQGSEWTVDAGTTTMATVTSGLDGTEFRDFTTIAQKGTTLFYANTHPVENIEGEGDFGVAEDAQDMGHQAINWGTEPLWFRFGVNPTDGHGLEELNNAGDAYSNALVGGDPETAVFTVQPGVPFRQHVLMPTGPGRGSTFDLHGHVWQRMPYVCPNDSDLGIPGKCNMGNGHAGLGAAPGGPNGAAPGDPYWNSPSVGSQNLGNNPIGMGQGGIDAWFPGSHYEVVIPKAGGGNEIPGDYLFRDHMGLGNAQGLWGILRVGDY
jgi:hypothetical protein